MFGTLLFVLIFLGCILYVLYRIIVKRIKLNVIDIVLLIPLLINILFAGYSVFIAAPGSCGSQNAGPCFGYGLYIGLIFLPLACIMTPIAAVRLFKKNKSQKEEVGK